MGEVREWRCARSKVRSLAAAGKYPLKDSKRRYHNKEVDGTIEPHAIVRNCVSVVLLKGGQGVMEVVMEEILKREQARATSHPAALKSAKHQPEPTRRAGVEYL